MQVLAIETSTLTGSVALLSGEEVIGEITLSVSVQHSERLMPAVERLLTDSNLTATDIDLYAVAIGPGSFTGLRIGIATAQGLSLAGGKPLVGVSTLEALAVNALFFPGLIVPILNANRGEIYRGLYQQKNVGTYCGPYLNAVDEDRVIGVDKLIAELRHFEGPILLLGNGTQLHKEKLLKELGGKQISFAPPSLQIPRASHLAVLALEKWNRGDVNQTALPRYLRVPG